ncbi:hypothetical protein GCM10010303_13240 [Streptomyces purpurascens]|nr:hypothetical protein GCM10010303_13240 [Streptomyces purpurascens]
MRIRPPGEYVAVRARRPITASRPNAGCSGVDSVGMSRDPTGASLRRPLNTRGACRITLSGDPAYAEGLGQARTRPATGKPPTAQGPADCFTGDV